MKTTAIALLIFAMLLGLLSLGCGHSATELLPLISTPASPSMPPAWEDSGSVSEPLVDQPRVLLRVMDLTRTLSV